MIHDILMSLLAPNNDGGISIAEFLKSESSEIYLHPCEREILKYIISIGNKHKEILNFIQQYSSANLHRYQSQKNDSTTTTIADIETIPHPAAVTDSIDEEPLQQGLYLQAFANGIDNAIEPYRKTIIDMETHYFQKPNYTLMFVSHQIKPYQYLFSILLKFIVGIKTQRLHGCAILQYLQQHSLHGNPNISQAIQTIQKSVYTVFIKQLSWWLIYGRFVDIHSEFFIQNSEQQTSNNSDRLTSNNSAGGGGTTTGIGQNFSTVTTTDSAAGTELWRYEICYEMLPQYLTPTWAEKVLFIGQTVVMFDCDPQKRYNCLSNTRYNKSINSIDNDEDVNGDETDADNINKEKNSSLWNNREIEFFNKIQSLQCGTYELDVAKHEQIIDEIKNYISKRLSEIAINQADLVQQLKLIKDFYLIGRGELFLEFIKQTSAIKSTGRVTEKIVRDITRAFHSAAHSVNVIDDLEQFSLSIPIADEIDTTSTLSTYDYDSNDYLQFIELKYKVKWPLQLLFSPKVIDRYNDMFRFLLQIKKIQYELHMVWCQHREQKLTKNHDLRQFRHKLMYLIDNLQYYLQVDVLEDQFTILMNAVQQSNDFEHIKRTHIIFQANILSLCFLLFGSSSSINANNFFVGGSGGNGGNMSASAMMNASQMLSVSCCVENPVLTILNRIIQRIKVFCKLSMSCSDPMTDEEKLLFESCERLFANHVTDLMNLLTGFKAGPSSAPLAQLLLRLDYNYWFSSKDSAVKNE